MSHPGAEPPASATANHDSASPSSDENPTTAAAAAAATGTPAPAATGNSAPAAPPTAASNSNVPKPKRLACTICRKRKLRCDGIKPSCSTCTRLGHSCAYDEVRRKSGPKRGYVKALEERLKQVERLLQTQEPTTSTTASTTASTSPETTRTPTVTFEQPRSHTHTHTHTHTSTADFNVPHPDITMPDIEILKTSNLDRWHMNANSNAINTESPRDGSNGGMNGGMNCGMNGGMNGGMNPAAASSAANTSGGGIGEFTFPSSMPMEMPHMSSNFTWEMIGLGLEEPLPPQETIDELHQIFFEKVHPSSPMIHKYRYLAAMNLAPNQRPPVALRYAVWTLACSITEKYTDLRDLFYQRARKYVEADYIKGYGEHIISVAHAQTHVLLAGYEFKMMYFPRAWQSAGSASRLAQMVGLHRLDRSDLEVKVCLPPPRDWTEREERRRTFWAAFCMDRYASIGTGWPLLIDERDIATNLPSSDDAFEMSRPEETQTLADSMCPSGASKLSPFGSVVLMACLFGRNLVHLHRPDTDDRDHDLNGEFWKRHRSMDNILLNTSLCLPNSLKLPAGLSNPNVVFANMNIHTSTICLHQAAIFKADKNKLPTSVGAESKVRCITAANEIASIMRMVSHMDLSIMNPFVSFCLYVAARVFVQYLKSRPDDGQTADSLRFLLAAMGALKRKNPLTESFLVQLDVDLEALGTRIPKLKSAFPRSGETIHKVVKLRKEAFEASGVTPQRHDDFLYRDDNRFMNPGDDNNRNGNTGNHHNWLSDDQQVPTPDCGGGGGGSRPAATGNITISPDMYSAAMNYVHQGGGASSGETNDVSVSPNTDGLSNKPTPNSSAATSDQQRQSTTSGNTPFTPSPMYPQTNAGGPQAETADATAAAAASNFFADMSAAFGGGAGGGRTGFTPGRVFGVPDASSSAGNEFTALPNGWAAGMPDQAMTPVAEGVLRRIIEELPSMDPMDLSGWDSGA